MPVNRAAPKGNWPGSNRITCPGEPENFGLHPIYAGVVWTLS